MSDFTFDLDFEAELARMGRSNRDKSNRHEQKPNPQGQRTVRPQQKPAPRQQPRQEVPNQASKQEGKTEIRKETHNRNIERQDRQTRPSQTHTGGNSQKKQHGSGSNEPVAPTPTDIYEPEMKRDPEPEGLEVKQSQQESFRGDGGGNASSDVETSITVNWKQFKTLPGIFEHVGGARPVQLNKNIKKSQVSGIPEPMFGFIQDLLKERHEGAVLHFPWGEYEITDKNKVFTAKASLVRYMLFDSLRDNQDTHLQYAKQWLALHHPTVFYQDFNPSTNLTPNSDELDIYALLFVASQSQETVNGGSNQPSNIKSTEFDFETNERLTMMNMNLNQILDKLNQQEQRFERQSERGQMMQTVLLLDRMGLLKGGLPRDINEFARILEQNRDMFGQTGALVDSHIHAEKERKKTLERHERMLKMQQRQAPR